MPDCYLCGAYIKRGAGYRREVQTGRSVRVYATRRGGSSFGSSFGTRTVCRYCAEVLDRSREGRFVRGVLYCLGWGVCVWIGWQIIVAGTGFADLVGLALLLGLPIVAASAVVEQIRVGKIRRDVRDEMFGARRHELTAPGEAGLITESANAPPRPLQPKPTILPLHLSPDNEVEGRELGVSVDPDLSEDAQVFRTQDTILSWAERIGGQLRDASGKSKEELRGTLVNLAKVARPKVGEGIHQFHARALERLRSIDLGLDPTSPSTALREGEDLGSWLRTYVPLCLVAEDGTSLDDMFPKLEKAAQFRPPQPDQSAATWIGNVHQFLA